MSRIMLVFITAVVGSVLCCVTTAAAEPEVPPALRERAGAAIDRGLAYLARQQSSDGGWSDRFRPAVTAIAARALMEDDDYGARHPVVRRAIDFILKFQQPDGGIYERESNLANYETSVALSLLARLDEPAARARVTRAQEFLAKLQYDAGESIDGSEPWYGGAGYNETKRPDLSNTQMMLEALHESGLPEDHPVYQKALKFVSRCQLLDATNDQPYADGMSDGGFIYSTNNGGESKASEGRFEKREPLRSYGSMTYAGFKSMLYAGVERDDPRIRACLKWIRANYTLDANPGMPPPQSREGLFYYFHVFARALQIWGEPEIVDARGVKHAWRVELCEKVISLQKPDGSWANDAPRWLESDPHYATAILVHALQIALDEDDQPLRPATARAKAKHD